MLILNFRLKKSLKTMKSYTYDTSDRDDRAVGCNKANRPKALSLSRLQRWHDLIQVYEGRSALAIRMVRRAYG
jgi:hypothetical protein